MAAALIRTLTGLRGRIAGERRALNAAREAQRRRDWPAAERHWRTVVEQSPRRAGAWIQLGNMLNELERRSEAIAAFTEAGRIDPALAHAPAGIAGVHERTGRWRAAEAAWRDAIHLLLASPQDGRAQQELAHAYQRAAVSARNSGAFDRAADLLAELATGMSDPAARAENLITRAQLLQPGNAPAATALLRDYIALFSGGSADEIAARSAAIATGDLRQGLADLMPAIMASPQAPSFLLLSMSLFEQAGLWDQVQVLAEAVAASPTIRPDDLVRVFRAAAERGDLAVARRIARAHARRTGDLILVHELLSSYEANRDYRRARLLARFLRRRWPHSRWHVGQYVMLTARTRSLDHADYLVRADIAAGNRDNEIEQAYCRAAFYAGRFAEAEQRMEAHLAQHPGDESIAVMLGYARANAVGIEPAEDYFASYAARSMQSAGAMIGLAHMAMRRRDLPAVLERWHRISVVHPDDSIAHVEMARCAYEMRDIAGALAICERRLAANPADITMGEFYAWLLTANGRYEDARAAIAAVGRHAGPSWDRMELAVQCAGQLGTLDRDWSAIMQAMPGGDTAEAARRFYHVARRLVTADRPDRIGPALEATRLDPHHLAWLHPYLGQDRGGAEETAIEAHWHHSRRLVRDEPARRLDAIGDAEVSALLARAKSDQPTVHIVNKFEQPRGGSELHAIDLATEIGRHAKVELWAPEMPHPAFTAGDMVKGIDAGQGRVPRGGVLVFIGVYHELASWIADARPDRVVFLYNTFESPLLFQRIDEVFARTGVRAELLFCSDMMQHECGLPGRFEPSPTDLELFSPALGKRGDRPFLLGRHSRDVVEKHHVDDWRIYQAVSELGGASQLLGGTCMRAAFPAVPGLELLPARSTGIPDFLRGLDAYLYRTSTWVEPWGRVVIEAMACGLPVLAHSVGGYAQAIRHEVDGLLFDTTDEAVRLVRRLVEEPELRRRLGEEARRSAERLLSPAEMRRLIVFYLIDA